MAGHQGREYFLMFQQLITELIPLSLFSTDFFDALVAIASFTFSVLSMVRRGQPRDKTIADRKPLTILPADTRNSSS